MDSMLIVHRVDPAIGIDLRERPDGTWTGSCTECGWPHWFVAWSRAEAISDARKHVDSHEAQVFGIDPSSVVRT